MLTRSMMTLIIALVLAACGLPASIEPGTYRCTPLPQFKYLSDVSFDSEAPTTKIYAGIGTTSWIEFRDLATGEILVLAGSEQQYKCVRSNTPMMSEGIRLRKDEQNG